MKKLKFNLGIGNLSSHTCKILIKMKLTLFFLFTSVISLVANDNYSQDTKLNLHLQGVTIKEALSSIEDQSEFYFMYSGRVIDVERVVSVNIKDQRIDTVLEQLFEGTNVNYTISDRIIVLTTPEVFRSGSRVPFQKHIVTGTVTEAETGYEIPGVNIFIKGTTQGTITDLDGNYSLEVPDENTVLVFSFVGYESQEIEVGGQTTINVILNEETRALEEVVVIGYGTMKKAHLTGAVDKLEGTDLADRPSPNVSNLLQGKVRGLTFDVPSKGYAPGETPTIQIRGQGLLNQETPPLIIIDGVPAKMSDFNALNPNNIEDISVLKDAASSAIYGARGAFGVILVSTKLGSEAMAPTVEFSNSITQSEPINIPRTTDAYTFIVSKIEAFKNANNMRHGAIRWFVENPDLLALVKDNVENPGKYSNDDLLWYANNIPEANSWGGPQQNAFNNNFQDIWLKNSIQQNYDLSIRGGGNNINYNLSAGYVYQPGILNFVSEFDDYRKANFSGAVGAKINDWFRVTLRSNFYWDQTQIPNVEDEHGIDRIWNFGVYAWPTTPFKNGDGTYNKAPRIPQAMQGGKKVHKNYKLSNTLSFELNPAKGWNIHFDGNLANTFLNNVSNQTTIWDSRPLTGPFKYSEHGYTPFLTKELGIINYWTIQGYTSYEKSFIKHNFKIMVGAQAEEQNNRAVYGKVKNLIDEDIISFENSFDENPILEDELGEWATLGTFGRFNYDYDGKYLFEINARYDGSGYYREGKRWGLFPGASAGWVISKENFWQPMIDKINYTKFRVSYGSLGNQVGQGYQHVATYNLMTDQEMMWIFDGQQLNYLQIPQLINYDLTWERIVTINAGFELGMLNNRLNMEFDWFKRTSKDLVGPARPVPAVLGAQLPLANNTEMETKGWELQIGWKDNINKFSYGINTGLSDNVAVITKYPTEIYSIYGYYPGKKLGEIWGFEASRLLNETDFDEEGELIIPQKQINGEQWKKGDLRYEDLDGDKEISYGNRTVDNPGDQKRIGNNRARYLVDASINLGYDFEKFGRLDLRALFQGALKRDVWPQTGTGTYYWGANDWLLPVVQPVFGGEQLDFYRDENSFPELLEHLGENTDAKFPRPYALGGQGGKNFRPNTKYLIDASYLRLKSLFLTYTFSNELFKGISLKNLSIYFGAENLFTLTKVPKSMDVENLSKNAFSNRIYPQQRGYTLGLNFSF